MKAAGTTARAVLFVAVTITAAGCGSGMGAPNAVKPPDGPAVAQAAAPLLAQFALRVQRSSVGEHQGAIGGSELSLYVRPAHAQSADTYANRFMPLTAAVIPALFAKYPGIKWIDLCQEPAQASGAWGTTPVTRLEISREGSGRVDWQHGELATVLALERTKPLEFSIEWHSGVGQTSVWRAAAARALTLNG